MRLIAALSSMGAVAVGLLAAPTLTHARPPRSTYRAAPSYSHSRLFIAVQGHPRLHGVVSLRISGSNLDDDGIGYTLSAYVQPRDLFGSCPVSLNQERQNLINFPSRVGEIASDLDETTHGRFSINVKYQAGGARRVVVCAYTQYITDDVAVATLKYSFPAPRR